MKRKYRQLINEWCPELRGRRLDWNAWHRVVQPQLTYREYCDVHLSCQSDERVDPVHIYDHSNAAARIEGRNVWTCLVALLLRRKKVAGIPLHDRNFACIQAFIEGTEQ